MKKTLLLLALITGLASVALAHEGHEHTLLGTVSMLHQNHLEVKALKDGKATIVTLTEKTKILRDKAPATRVDLKAGERVAVVYTQEKDASGKEVLIAKEVRLGPAKGSGS